MQSENPLIADFVKMANAAAGTLAGMTREARDGARERMQEAMGGLDFVSMFVGSYTKLLTGAKSPGAFKGHGFVENYVPNVGEEISDDIKKR